MLATIARIVGLVAAMVVAGTSVALAETTATPAPHKVAQADAVATPTPNPLQISGYVRAFYFTRQNASNNPGTQFNFSTGKCPSGGTCVNQASFNSAYSLHADYTFNGGPWSIGGSYLYAQPFSGPCSVAPAHAKGQPCVSQIPPNTNPDDTLPGFMLSTFPEAYVAFDDPALHGKIGDMILNTPWANASDSRLKPEAYQGVNFMSSTLLKPVDLQIGYFNAFQNRTSNSFTMNNLMTTYPAGGGGLASNILVPNCYNAQCKGINTPGFLYFKAGYAPADKPFSVDGYFYGVGQVVNMYWGDARYNLMPDSKYKPFIALQGGWESNTGASVIGKIRSSDVGLQIGANVIPSLLLTGAIDYMPWQYDNVALPGAASCSSSTYQIHAGDSVFPATNFAYMLPINTAQCLTNHSTGLTQIAYGGWASPYTDNYATDPLFTTQISQGMADRRAPGTSWKFAATYTSQNKKWVFIASDAWYNYTNSIAPQTTNEWNLDGQYHFSQVPAKGHYRGLLLRYRYAQRTYSNTFFCGPSSPCPIGITPATQAVYLGGLPLFKYNRAQVEYDF